MNILVVGAGAMGSLFAAFLSQHNHVVLFGRSYQKNVIQKQGLTITGKTNMVVHLPVVDSVHDVDCSPDLIIIAVKSYDTITALNTIRSLVSPHTKILSLQNGLDNLEKIQNSLQKQYIFGGVTTHGAFVVKPGVVNHTGVGRTVIGSWNSGKAHDVDQLVSVFTTAGIKTQRSIDLRRDVWKKAVINSSINPLTALFTCTNGYLVDNPVLEGILKKICYESTRVACSQGIDVSFPLMIRLTKQVIRETAGNYSSMLQSIQQGKKTEIDAINGVIVRMGKQQGITVSLNQILVLFFNSLAPKQY